MNALAHQAVEIRAQTDALTGLKNQGTFQEYLQVAVNRGAPFSLLIVDLDNFKGFNDRRGHEAGNVLLAAIARTLRAACRDSDEVFRYGGDEFALILPNTDATGAMLVAAKVGASVRNVPGPGSRKAAGVTCSVGMAAFPTDGTDRVSVLIAADRACYVAKRNGRDQAATAAEGLALAGDILPQPPTPVDEAGPAQNAA
jgi:diguanylate cyclase (GGDEF)-like protein